MDAQTQFRLAKLLGLLGSDHDGEVVAAARAIKRLLESKGMTFADLVLVVANPTLPAVHDPMRDIVGMARAIMVNENMLKVHERQFVKDIIARCSYSHYELSEKQTRWFSYLFARYGESS